MEDRFKKERQNKVEAELKLRGIFGLGDFRAGHWPGTKTPPWWLNEIWEMENQEWKKQVKKMSWDEEDELLVGSGIINIKTHKETKEAHEVDVYARRDLRHGSDYFGFVAYPKGKSYSDYWDEEGNSKIKEKE